MSRIENNDESVNIPFEEQEDDQIVTPWTVSSKLGIDYLKIIDQFGCKPIDGTLIRKFEEVTGKKIHKWMRRGIFFSHRNLNDILNTYLTGEHVFQYTGRGSTAISMHLGHMLPFMFTKWLQDALDSTLVVQLSDDEKYFFKDGTTLEEFNRLAYENAKDIIACDFNLDKTLLFSNLNFMGGELYKNAVHIMKHTTGNQIRGIFGLNLDNNIGQLAWPCFQAAPAFSNSFDRIFGKDTHIPCLVSLAIDQEPFFRLCDGFADKFKTKGYLRPSRIHTKFLPSLEGINSKMSSTGSAPVIFMTDTEKEIEQKIKGCFSGGQKTKKEQQELGADLTVDIAYQYLLYFMEDDDELRDIAEKYKSGQMMTGEIKNILIGVVKKIVKDHQKKRNKVDQETLIKFFDINRKFDLTTKKKNEDIGEYNADKYSSYGFNFDPYFGLYN